MGREGSKGDGSVALASEPREKVGCLLESPQGLMFLAELADEEAMFHPLKMEQRACGCTRAGKGH